MLPFCQIYVEGGFRVKGSLDKSRFEPAQLNLKRFGSFACHTKKIRTIAHLDLHLNNGVRCTIYKRAYTRDVLLCCKIRQCSFLYLVIRSPGNKYLFQEGKIALCGPFQTNLILHIFRFTFYLLSNKLFIYVLWNGCATFANSFELHYKLWFLFDQTKATFSDRNNC